jgi:hypothetical protein
MAFPVQHNSSIKLIYVLFFSPREVFVYIVHRGSNRTTNNISYIAGICFIDTHIYTLTTFVYYKRYVSLVEEFQDTKGVIRIRKSKKNRQHNAQKKKYKRTNNNLQNIHIELKIE